MFLFVYCTTHRKNCNQYFVGIKTSEEKKSRSRSSSSSRKNNEITKKVKQQLILKSSIIEEDFTKHTFDCNFIVITKGDGDGCESGRKVHVKSITIKATWTDECLIHNIDVYHDSKSDIYTDTGFVDAISNALGYEVIFTESGMQKDNIARLRSKTFPLEC
jgi:hypothetical protein